VIAQAFEAYPVTERLLSAARSSTDRKDDSAQAFDSTIEDSFAPPLDLSPQAQASLALRQANYRGAAKVYWQAFTHAQGAEKKREFFELALRTMQSGNLLREGLVDAERYLPVLAPDPAMYRWLTRLALQSGQPELAQRYARLMLQLGWIEARGLPRVALFDHERLSAQPRVWRLVSNSAVAPAGRAKGAFDDASHQLGYEVFMANRNLADALLVAQTALKHLPESVTWRQRLAQVAQWHNQPELALEQRLWLARKLPSVESWQAVRALAQPLYDGAALLEIAQLQEALGDPRSAYKGLEKALREGRGTLPHALAILELAKSLGDEPARLTHAQEAIERFGFLPELAIHQALSHYVQGNERSALLVMRRMANLFKQRSEASQRRPGAQQTNTQQSIKQDVEFWPIYAELARKLGHVPLAIQAYQVLLASGEIEPGQLNTLVDLQLQSAPAEALSIAQAGWEKFREPGLLRRAFELLVNQQGIQAARQYATQHDPQGKWALLSSPSYLGALVVSLQKAGQWDDARPVVEGLLAQAPASAAYQAAMIWQLLGQRDAPALRRYLEAWATQAQSGSELSSAFAAAWLSLQEPRKALAYLVKRPDLKQDYLWQFAVAEALEQSGEVDRAWSLRQHLWRSRPQSAKVTPGNDALVQQSAAVGSLALRFAPADSARQLLHNMANGGGSEALVNELVLASMLSQGHSDTARAWLLARYANQLSQPAWARLSLALGRNDRAQLEQLLVDLPDWLPRADRMSALSQLGRDEEAMRVAQGFVERNPLDQPMAQRLGNLLLQQASALQIGSSSLRFGDYRTQQTIIDAQHRLSEDWWVSARAVRSQYSSTESVLASYLPRSDQFTQIGVRWQHLEHGLFAAFTARDSVGSSQGALLAHQWQPRGWRVNSALGLGQPTDETTVLRAAGQRDYAQSSFERAMSERHAVFGRAYYSNIRLQDGPALANGWAVSLGSSYTFLQAAPALRVNAQARSAQFRAASGLPQAQADFAARGWASIAGGLLPVSSNEASVGVSFGDASETRGGEGWSGRWMPIADASLIHNSVVGASYRFSVGAQGSVIGPDQLAFLFTRNGASAQQTQPSSFFNVHYRWLY
jgi:polysaccharide biosynthesis protein PelB